MLATDRALNALAHLLLSRGNDICKGCAGQGDVKPHAFVRKLENSLNSN